MPQLRTRLQQPTPVQQQVDLPPTFPAVPQEIVDRFPTAKDWQKSIDDFWAKTVQAVQSSQNEVASFNNSRVIFSVDTFQIYTKTGSSQAMFSLDSTGIKLGDVLVINTPARKVYIGAGTLGSDDTPFYVDQVGNFSLGSSLVWDPATDTLTITGTIIVTAGSIGGFNIGTDYIRDAANSMGLASTITGGDDVRFWAGDTFANRATAPFHVFESGALVATAAAITGTISGRSTATIAGAIDASGILITDLINAQINTSAKDILSDFDFGTVNYAGALKAGTITWNTTTGAITGGSGVAIYRNGLVGANAGVATFSIDATTGNATFAGTLSVPTGNIGGFTLGTDFIRDAANSMGLASTITGGDDVRFWAGAAFASRATAPFFVTEAGNITANNATIIGTISGRLTSTVAAAIDSSGNLVTDLINARLNTSAKTMLSDFTFGTTDYAGALKSGTIAWNTTTGAITGGSGVLVFRGGIIGANAGVPTFTLDATTGNATFAGTISATAGTVGGFNLGSDYIRDAGNSMGMASTVTGGDDVRFWAGSSFASRATAPFRVTEAGALNSTSGMIGGFSIGPTTLVGTSGTQIITLAASSGGGGFVRAEFDATTYCIYDGSGIRVATTSIGSAFFGNFSGALSFEIINAASVPVIVMQAATGSAGFFGQVAAGGAITHTSGATMDFRMTSSGAVAILGTVSANTLQFWTNNVARLSIASGGGINIPGFAGVGTRNVVADASGNLSAP